VEARTPQVITSIIAQVVFHWRAHYPCAASKRGRMGFRGSASRRDLLKRVEPTSRAKYVAFTTLLDPRRCRATAPRARLAVCGGAAPRRSDAPVDNPRGRTSTAKRCHPERCPDAVGGALEVRLQRLKSIVKITLTEKPADNMESAAPHE